MGYVSSAGILLFVVQVGAQASVPAPGPRPLAPAIEAESAILTDAVTGQILYEKNARVRRPVASTTKIMTAILVIENCDMDDVVTASEAACQAPFTSLHMKPGEQLKVRDLLAALLIRSANDAAVALAEHIGGTVEGFVQMMNDKARQIGARDTHFLNPNGLYVPGHYSTACDLALMARRALRSPVFNELVATQSKIVERSVNKQDVLVQTHSRFLKHYNGADGVKSGYTKESGYCYVGSATRGGWRLVSAVLKSPDSQVDTTALMDYGFSSFRRVVLAARGQAVGKVQVKGGSSELEVVPSEELHAAVRAGERAAARAVAQFNEIHAPIRRGEKVGTLTAYVGSNRAAAVDLVAAHDVDESLASAAWPWIRVIGLAGMISIGVASGRAAAKGAGGGRRRLT